MSLLPPEVHAAVNQLLVGLQASDNVVRTQAEETLNTEWISPRPEVLLMALAEQIIGADVVGVCLFF
jgi:importin-5